MPLKFGYTKVQMPTTSQSLLSRRQSPRSVLSQKRQQDNRYSVSSDDLESDVAVVPVNTLNVQFPKIYLDQRYGYSLLKSEYGEYIADTSNVDKIVKEYMKTGNDQELEFGPPRSIDKPNNYENILTKNVNVKGTNIERAIPTTFSANEFVPLRRKIATPKLERSYSDSQLDKKPSGNNNGQSDYVEAEDVLHPGKQSNMATYGDDGNDNGQSNLESMEANEYVYFQLGPAMSNDDKANEDEDWLSASQTHIRTNVVKFKKIEADILSAVGEDDRADALNEEVFIDDSNPEKIVVYRMSGDRKLVKVKNAEVETTGDGRTIIRRMSAHLNGQCEDDETLEGDTITFSHIVDNGTMLDDILSEHKAESVTTEQYKREVIANNFVGSNEQFKHHNYKKKTNVNNANLKKQGYPSESSTSIIKNAKVNGNKESSSIAAKARHHVSFKSEVSYGGKKSNTGTGKAGKGGKKDKPMHIETSIRYGDDGIIDYSRAKKPDNQDDLPKEPFNGHDLPWAQPYTTTSQENSFTTTDVNTLHPNALEEQTETSRGLTRLQQLTVEKKLKYLEPPVYFYEHPEPEPLKVCFEICGTDLTHKQVLKAMLEPLEYIADAKVNSMQFVARNVILGTMWVENRWVIELSTQQCVTVLLGRGITIHGEPVKIRKYDDIIKEDYNKFLQNKDNFVKKGGSKKSSKFAASQPSQNVNAISLNYLKPETDKDGDVTTLLSQTADPHEITVL